MKTLWDLSAELLLKYRGEIVRDNCTKATGFHGLSIPNYKHCDLKLSPPARFQTSIWFVVISHSFVSNPWPLYGSIFSMPLCLVTLLHIRQGHSGVILYPQYDQPHRNLFISGQTHWIYYVCKTAIIWKGDTKMTRIRKSSWISTCSKKGVYAQENRCLHIIIFKNILKFKSWCEQIHYSLSYSIGENEKLRLHKKREVKS